MKLNVYVCEGWRWMKHCCTSALCLCPGCRDGLGAAVSKSSGQCGQSWVMLSWQGTESAGHPHGPLLLQALQVGSQGHPSWGHTLLSPLSAFTTEPFFHQLSSPILYFLFFWENRAQFNKKSRLFWYTWALMIDSQTFLIIQLQDRPSVFKINLKMPQRRKLSLKIFLFDAGGWDSRWKQLNVPRRGSSSSGHCLPQQSARERSWWSNQPQPTALLQAGSRSTATDLRAGHAQSTALWGLNPSCSIWTSLFHSRFLLSEA